MALFLNLRRSTATAWSKSSGFVQRLERVGHSRTATNGWLRHLPMARIGYWMMTPYKIPARIAFIRQLTLNNEQLLVLNAELAARSQELSAQNAELAVRSQELSAQNAELAVRSRGLSAQNAELAARSQELSAQNAELAARSQELSAQNAELAAGSQKLSAQNAALAAKSEELSNQNAELAAKSEQLSTQNAELTAKSEQLSNQNAELAAKSGQLSTQNAEHVTKIEHLKKQSALDRPLAFMHVPKTSGVSLTYGVLATLPSTNCLNCYDRGFFGASDSSETILPPARHEVYDALPPGDGIDFVAGHITYSTLVQGRPAARFMTVLREPRSRILSLWTFYRSQSDETISNLAAFGRVVRLARRSLVEFLNRPEAACHTDNKYVRMLLWPHPLIPDNGFIDNASDERLAREAAERLKAFHFADVIENPRLEDNVRAFLARPFVYRRENETPPMPSELRVPLEAELSREALLLVEHRSRLDRELWRALAAERIVGTDAIALSDDKFRETIIRHAALMSPEGPLSKH